MENQETGLTAQSAQTEQKAYSFQRLMEIAREEGGPEAEKFLKANYRALKRWANESAVISPNKVDDAAIPAGFAMLDGYAMPVLDQVDGIKGN